MPSERLPDHRGPRPGRGGGNLRQLLALLVLGVGTLSLAQEVHPLPLPLGRINDYGQTLERSHREALEERIEAFSQLGIEFWYLASWRDPYGNPWRYAAEIAAAWGLGSRALLVAFVQEEQGWEAVGWRGEEIKRRLPDEVWLKALRDAERDLLRHHPSRAILSLADGLLAWFREGRAIREGGGGLSPGAMAGVVLGGLYLVIRLLREVRLRRRRGII